MATWMECENFMRPPLTEFAATAKIDPTRIGQHQAPAMEGMATAMVHIATHTDWPSFSSTSAREMGPEPVSTGATSSGPQLPSGQS